MQGRLQTGLIFFFLAVFPLAVKLALERASVRVDASGAAPAASDRNAEFRAELLMGLDLFVRAQNALRVESAMYTRSIGKMPDVLGGLSHFYRIEIARATRNRLLVVAHGEGRKLAGDDEAVGLGDRVSINEKFQVNSNFPLPEPPRDYLHVLAKTVMNNIASRGMVVPERSVLDTWEGVFRDYFRYEVRSVSAGGRTIMAVGLAGPVKGDLVEMQRGANLFEWVHEHRHTTWADREVRAELERVYLAQKIYHAHTGSYAPSFKALVPAWTGLSKLGVEQSPLAIQEVQLDPTFGFLAEVGRRDPSESEDAGSVSNRSWSVNAYGQMSEVSGIENIVDQFELARKSMAGLGIQAGSWAEAADPAEKAPVNEASRQVSSTTETAQNTAPETKSEAESGRKTLVIEAIDGQ